MALIWGENEVTAGTVTIKPLREQVETAQRLAQQTLPIIELESALRAALGSGS